MSTASMIVPTSLLAVLLIATPAPAHEGGVDMRGEVLTADAKQVTVRSGDGHEQHFALTSQTRITLEGIVAKPTALSPGLPAVVHGKKVGGVTTATSIQLARPRKSVDRKRPPAP
jgi:hypothetical protein